MNKKYSGFLLGSCLILLISFFTFLPSFHLALFGDDWLAFWRYLQRLGPASKENWTHFSYFLTPYGPQDIMMGLLYKIFGFQGSYYQSTSYILRLVAAFSLFPIVQYITKNRLATFFAVLFFSITTTGIETTNWVFNMPTYISIAFFNLFLFFLLRSQENKKMKLLLPAIISFFFAYIWAPIRMTGALPFIFLYEFFQLLRKKNMYFAKRIVLSLSLILGTFLFTSFIGQSNGSVSVWTDRFFGGIQTGLEFIQTGRFDFLFYPFIIFGGMFFPDFVMPLQWNIQSVAQLIFSIIIPTFLLFMLFTQLIITNITKIAGFRFRKIMLFYFIWSLIVIFIYSQNTHYLSSAIYLFLFVISGYFIILSLFLLFKFIYQTDIAEGIFLAISWSFLSFFFAWWWMPDTIYPSTHRYLMVSAIGISILFAMIISLGKKNKNQVYLTIILSPFLILHLVSTNYYLRLMGEFHSQQITDKIWSAIPYNPDVGRKPLVFYFEGDDSNYVIMHNVLTFGFPPHMQLLYHLTESDYAPVPMRNWNEVVSAVSDGQSFKPYGYPLKPIPIENVYAFHLQGKDNLVNITDIARKKLSEKNNTN